MVGKGGTEKPQGVERATAERSRIFPLLAVEPELGRRKSGKNERTMNF